MGWCGDAEQTTEHILQDCRNLQSLRDKTWPKPTTIHKKLYGPVEELKRTTIFHAFITSFTPKCNQAVENRRQLGIAQ
jgi:hypothetical protein